MDINKYGKLPRISLINALGTIKTTVIHKGLLPSANICAKCNHTGLSNYNCSAECPYLRDHVADVERTLYVYEHRKSTGCKGLSLIGIKTLMLLHMLTTSGGINDFEISDAADYLQCCPLSVKNALTQLSAKGYILCQAGYYPGTYTILINDYTKNLSLTAAQGGSGYITINQSLMDAIASCKTITDVRLLLRTFDFAFSEKNHTGGVILYTQELLKTLPAYVSKSKLIQSLSHLIIVLTYDTLKKRIRIHKVSREICTLGILF